MGNSLYRRMIRRVAVHEAGHFTFYAAISDEYPIVEASVDVLSGHVTHSGHPPPNFRSVVGLLAGLAAQKVLLRTTNLYYTHRNSSDIIKARNIAHTIDRNKRVEIMRAGRVAAERFARANRKQIAAIARTLCRLVGSEIDCPRLMARLNPLPPLTAIPPREFVPTSPKKKVRA
jgi:hypothetical protein